MLNPYAYRREDIWELLNLHASLLLLCGPSTFLVKCKFVYSIEASTRFADLLLSLDLLLYCPWSLTNNVSLLVFTTYISLFYIWSLSTNFVLSCNYSAIMVLVSALL